MLWQALRPLPRKHSSVQQSRVRRDDHVVQRQERVVRVDRLLLEDVQPGPGDAPLASASVSARWSTIGPRAVLIR